MTKAERIAELEAEARDLRNAIGCLCMEHGDGGELLISNRTLQEADGFTIEIEEARAGVVVRAIANR